MDIFICSVFSLHKDRYDHYVFCVYRAIIKQITEQNNIEQKLTHICLICKWTEDKWHRPRGYKK